MGELEGPIAGDRRPLDGRDQVPLEQSFEQRGHIGVGREMLQRPAPEHTADHGGVLQQAFVLRVEQVDPGCDQRLDAVGDPVERCTVEIGLEQHARRLLEEQRVALRFFDEQRALFLPLAVGGRQQQRRELVALVGVERRKLDRRRTRIPAAPSRTGVEQVEAGDADEQHRDRAPGACEVLDDLEEALFGPLHVLEDEDERLRIGELLGPAQGRPGDLCVLADPLGRAEQAECDAEQVGDGIALAGEPQFLERLRGRVVVGDARRRFDHRCDRPVRDALAVGERAAGEDGRTLDALRELRDQSRLADSRVAEHRREVGAPVAQRAVVGVLQQLELGLPTDERRLSPPLAGCEQTFCPPRPDRLARSNLDRACVLGVDGAGGQPPRAGTDRHGSGRSRLLETGGEHHGFTGHERRVAVADDHLARFDARAGLQAELVDRLDDREGGTQRPLRVVLVSLGHPECRHHRVTGELLDRASMQLDARRGALEVAVDPATYDLGIARGHERRRVDEIDEEHGCELPLHSASLGSGEHPAWP